MSLLARISTIFKRANIAFGSPFLEAVKPLDQWTLPAGFSYDRSIERVVSDTTGDVLMNVSDYWGSLNRVYIVPNTSRTGAVESDFISMAGPLIGGDGSVLILREDIDTVKQSFAILLDGVWYNVGSVDGYPPGRPALATVSLERRVS